MSDQDIPKDDPSRMGDGTVMSSPLFEVGDFNDESNAARALTDDLRNVQADAVTQAPAMDADAPVMPTAASAPVMPTAAASTPAAGAAPAPAAPAAGPIVLSSGQDISGMDRDTLVAVYLERRDFKEAVEARHKTEKAQAEGDVAAVTQALLAHMNATAEEKFSAAGVGSVRKTVKRFYNVRKENAEAFKSFCFENGYTALLPNRPSKTEMDKFVSKHSNLPAGVEMTEELDVTVRRAS